MGAPVVDLEAGLQAMLNLKPPGVSGSRITSLTSLCVTNIQSESVLIQKIYTHFKKAPGTHKLGVLYVVDSVTRKWLEQAKTQGQTINSSAPDGTEAAAVNRVTELMPVLMNDILQHMPNEQKEKIKKLLDIWEKGQTFPQNLLDTWKQKLAAPPAEESTTPPGSPPANGILASLKQQPSAPAPPSSAQNGTSILQALANMARQNTNAAPSSAAPASQNPVPAYSMPPATSGPPQPASSSSMPQQPQVSSYPQTTQAPFNMSSLPFALPQAAAPSHAAPAPNLPAPTGGALDSNTQQQIMLIKALAEQGVPFDKIPALLQTLGGAGVGGAQPQPTVPPSQNSYGVAQPSWAPPPVNQDGYRNSGGYQDGRRSPPKYGRSRSRSPDRGWGSRGSPRGGREYGRDSPRDGRRSADYRNRSPPGRRGRSPDPHDGDPGSNKWVDHDSSLPSGSIRVLSRTLFVGGVTCPEPELRNIFSRFGTVQSCIVNKDKRHAFVKMLTRRAAVAAKEGTENLRDVDIPLRTRWGVGFGPRDCSDYATGISVIPIHRLTEADRKWMLTAPYGGSGGRPIETGLVVEEPDIEIGAGVSSKAISRRMQTDKGGSNGPKSTRGNTGQEERYSKRRDHESGSQGTRSESNNPAVPEFPFGLGTLPNGMPNIPNGFAFPDPQHQANSNPAKWA